MLPSYPQAAAANQADYAAPVASGPVIAAIDIGSNTVKMTVARPGTGGAPAEILRLSETVRLGAGMDETGRLADDRIAAALDALARFAAEARAVGATRLIGVATEATRTAANGAAFLDRVRRATGLELRVISGDEEAALTFRGLTATTDVSGQVVVADIGGGSTEVIVAADGTVRRADSVRLGSGLLTDRLVTSDPPTAAELDACRAAAAAALAAVPLPGGSATRLIVIGGTGEYLIRLVPADQPLDERVVDAVLARLRQLPAAELAGLIAIAEARARVLPAGVAVVRALVELIRPGRIAVAPSGIRTGLLLAAFAEEAADGQDA